MIKVVKRIKITTGQAPFTYQWTTSNNCLTFSQASGVITGDVLETTLNFATEACNPTINLIITSACGNSETFPISVTLPCTSLVLNPITADRYKFTVTAAAPGCSKVTFKWDFDTAVWGFRSIVDSPFSSTLDLSINKDFNLTTPIKVTATDCNNCVKEATYTFTLELDRAPDETVVLYPIENGVGYESGNLTFKLLDGAFKDTITQTLPTSISFTKVSDGVYKYTFNQASFPNNTYVSEGTYTFITKDVLKTLPGKITFILKPAESTVKPIDFQPKTVKLNCVSTPNFVTLIDITNDVVVKQGYTVDWSSFLLLSPPEPKSSSIKLVFQNNRQYIEYTAPNPVTQDVFQFRLCTGTTLTGQRGCTTGVVTIIPCIQEPQAVNDTFTVAANTTTEVDVLLNDLGNGSPPDEDSIVVSDVQSGITVVPNPNGKIAVTVQAGVTGTRTFKYKFKNWGGYESNVATVTLNIVSAGVNTNVILCD